MKRRRALKGSDVEHDDDDTVCGVRRVYISLNDFIMIE